LFESKGIEASGFALVVIACHFAGLLTAGIIVRTSQRAEIVVQAMLLVCAACTSLYFTSPGFHWFIALPVAGYAAGICLASFGYFFHRLTVRGQRFRTAADMLIASNILMILLNVTSMEAPPTLMLSIAILLLLFSFLLSGRLFRLPQAVSDDVFGNGSSGKGSIGIYPLRPLLILCLFIAVVTIDSGLMYRVVNPNYAHLDWLAGWYWAVPYVAVLLLLRNLPGRIDRTYFLYIAISMIGVSFLGFMILDRSVASYLIVNTLMMGASGVFDLFWWSILGEMLDDWPNRARLFGAGLAANVLGILIGGSIASRIAEPSIVALFVVFAVLILLPVMNRQLSAVRSDHAFLSRAAEYIAQGDDHDVENSAAVSLLTKREQEIINHLLTGRTNRMIAAELHLSENTVKTHVKNIYGKFEVQSRTELLRRFLDDRANKL
jgi:DNA-binding CsgD family transcriptional regulator